MKTMFFGMCLSLSLFLFGCGDTTSPSGCSGVECNPPQKQACDVQPPASGAQVAVSYIQQECDELCWAAAVDMVAQPFNKSYSQCQTASFMVSSQAGQQYNCCYYSACNDQYCNRAANDQMIGFVIKNGLKLYYSEISRPLSQDELKRELANNRPVIVGYQGPFSGHVAVIVGYSAGNPTMYTVYDPWPQFGMFTTAYENILSGPQTPWRTSFYRFSQNQSGPPSNFCSGQ